MKTNFIRLLLSLSCCSTMHIYANNNTSVAMDHKNITGTWHCRLESPQLRYEAAMTYHANKSYSDNGTVHQLKNGKWITVNYQGNGRWGFNNSRHLNISNYSPSYTNSPHMNDEDIDFAKHHTASAKIVRLGSQMLVLQLNNQLGSPTARCTKRI